MSLSRSITIGSVSVPFVVPITSGEGCDASNTDIQCIMACMMGVTVTVEAERWPGVMGYGEMDKISILIHTADDRGPSPSRRRGFPVYI